MNQTLGVAPVLPVTLLIGACSSLRAARKTHGLRPDAFVLFSLGETRVLRQEPRTAKGLTLC